MIVIVVVKWLMNCFVFVWWCVCFDVYCLHSSPMCTILLEDVMVRLLPLPEEWIDIIAAEGVELGAELHLDTDEGNACMIREAVGYELFRKEKDGSLTKVFEKSLVEEAQMA